MRGILQNRLVLSVLGLVLVTAVGITYLFGQVLKTPLTHRAAQVSVEMERTGGLFEGAPASYRGVRVGTVRSIGIDDGAVRAVVELRDGAEVPRDTRAEVRSLSPVGEQYLDFRPGSAQGPFLADGDVIEAEATDVPVAVADAADELIGLVEAVDRRDLRTVLRETSAAVGGSSGDLESLLRSTDELTTALDGAWPATDRLLRNGERVGELLARNEGRLRGFSADAQRLAAFLRDYDPRFRRLLEQSPRDLDQIGLLMDDLALALPPFLRAMVLVGQVTYEREPHLRALGPAMNFGFGRFLRAFRGGWLHINLELQGQEQCEYGVGPRDGTSADRRPLATDGHCTLTDHVWRGTEHAPPPLDR
jgi:phospholipid/cholesterol/gamma-HCH transport system substrate-binding protein